MDNKIFDLTGKTAVVTGSSTGLGKGMAIGLAEAGAELLLVDYVTSVETLNELKKMNRKAEELVVNLMEKDSPKKVIEKAISVFGKVDILVNNAGIIRRTPAVEFSEKDWDEVMYLNSKVPFLLKALANEWAKYGLNINAIAPGYMATNNTKALREDPVRSKAILDRIPAERWGTPEDLKGVVVFLASSASDYVNGHVLVVDGGWLAR
jgi:2-deoxy-D-gluconate 3-dehydrogenase